MPYELPTANQLSLRFPAFACISSAIKTESISEASRGVSTSWCEADYQLGIMLLAAHNMTEEGLTGRDTGVTGAVVSSKLGDASDTYANHQNADTSGVYSSTVYGRRFMQLRRANTQGVRLL